MMHSTRSTSAIGFLADLRHGKNHDLDAAAQWRLRLEVISLPQRPARAATAEADSGDQKRIRSR